MSLSFAKIAANEALIDSIKIQREAEKAAKAERKKAKKDVQQTGGSKKAKKVVQQTGGTKKAKKVVQQIGGTKKANKVVQQTGGRKALGDLTNSQIHKFLTLLNMKLNMDVIITMHASKKGIS